MILQSVERRRGWLEGGLFLHRVCHSFVLIVER